MSTNLLDLSRIDAGIFPLDMRWGDLRDPVRAVVEAHAELAEGRGISLVSEVPTSPVMLRFDRERIVQLLSNLVGNALKFTKRGGEIVVALAEMPDGGRLEVRDSGPGIPRASCHSSSTASSAARTWAMRALGSGLGLAIARSIVEMHGGHISAASAVGQGSVFTVDLPRAEAVSQRKVHETSRPHAAPRNRAASRWSPSARVARKKAKHHDRRESHPSANGRSAPTEQVEVRRFGPPPTQAAPSPYSVPPQSASLAGRPALVHAPPVAAAPVRPERRRVAGGGVVALAIVAGIVSGSLSAAAVTTLLADENGATTNQTPLGTNVSQVHIDESSAVINAVNQAMPAVVKIQSQTGTGGGIGTGFIYNSDGWILTNKHVVDGAEQLTVILSDSRELPARLYGIDTLTDLAIIKVDESGLPTVSIGSSAELKSGQLAIAIGNPLGEFENTVTTGVISGLGRQIVAGDSITSSARAAEQPDPDRCGHQPGQLGRPAARLGRPGHRRQHRRQPGGPGDRLRDPDRRRQTDHAAGANGEQLDTPVDRRLLPAGHRAAGR